MWCREDYVVRLLRAPRSVSAKLLLVLPRHGFARGCGVEQAGDAAGACLRLFVTCLVLQVATTRLFRSVNAFAKSVGAHGLDLESRVLDLCLLC